jgi:hypothetical protein
MRADRVGDRRSVSAIWLTDCPRASYEHGELAFRSARPAWCAVEIHCQLARDIGVEIDAARGDGAYRAVRSSGALRLDR